MSEREEIKIYSELPTTVRYTDNHQIGIMRSAPASIMIESNPKWVEDNNHDQPITDKLSCAIKHCWVESN